MRNFARPFILLRNALAHRLILAALLPLLVGPAVAQLLGGVPTQPVPHVPGALDQTPRAVKEGTATFVEHYDPAKMIRLALVLNPPHPVEEAQFLEDIQNKQSPLFHHFLTADEWNARFSPSVQDEQAVADWAQSQGFTITYRFPNRLIVDVEAPIGAIEKAFSVTINRYQSYDHLGVPGDIEYSNDRDPVLPSQVASLVQAVQGLNSFARMRPATSFGGQLTRHPDYIPGPVVGPTKSAIKDAVAGSRPLSRSEAAAAPRAPVSTNGTSDSPSSYGFSPADIWSAGAYDYDALMRQGHCCNPTGNSGSSPVESSIAIAAYAELDFNDIDNFHAGYPYLAYNVETLIRDGGPGACNNSPNLDDGCVEVTLDTEWALSTANSEGAGADTAKVFVYEGDPGYWTDLWNHMLSEGNARVMSTSWGCSEDCAGSTYIAASQTVLSNMVGQGWTLVAASGDQGSTAGCGSKLAVQYPSSDINVVGTGGTSLSLYMPGNAYDDAFESETAWQGSTYTGACSKNGGGSTGGFSAYIKTPSYQSNMGFPSRAVPDIALNSDPNDTGQNVYYYGAWRLYGGTSIAAPMIAGFFAQENAYLLSIGNACGLSGTSACAPMGNPLYAIYGEAKHPNAGHFPFYDTLTGCGSNDLTNLYNLTPYCAGTGFDEITGWGTANMLQLAWAINWEVTAASGIPYTTFTGPAINTWYNSNQNIGWTINDYTAGSPVGTGIAGFTQGWDYIPGDSYSQPNGAPTGSTDTFYTGPQFVNGSGGCLALASGEGCAGGVTQGCHVAHVRGFNNQGFSTGDSTYGPVCYDTVAPSVGLTTNPVLNNLYVNKSVTFTLAASDPGGSSASGIANTYYNFDSSCTTQYPINCFTYSGPVTITADGVHALTYFTEDNAGNFSAANTYYIYIDKTAPATSLGLSGSLVGTIWQSAVVATLTAADSGSGVQSTVYSLDGARNVYYTGPITVSTPGAHTLKYYSIDYAGNAEATNVTTFTIESPTTTTFTASPTTSTPGTAVTLKATLAASLSGTPGGTISFHNGTTVLGTVALSGLSASLTTSALPVGNNVLYAVYNGATYYLASTSGTVTASVTSPTTTTLTSSVNPAKFGAVVTFKATVKAAAGTTPTGTVTFKDGTITLGSAALTSGVASLMAPSLSVASHNITAIYGGNGADLTSTSAVLDEIVGAATTTTKVTSALNPAKFGSAVLFTATVTAATGSTPTGKVAFHDGTALLTTLAVNASGVATYSSSNLAVGAHPITAVYLGDTDDATSTSAVLNETVQAATTTTSLTSSLSPAAFGVSVKFTAKVAAASGSVPTGTVTFKTGATVLGTATLAGGSGSLSIATLTPGTHSITAVFTADTDDATSTSAPLSQAITAATTTTTLKTSAAAAKFGAQVTFTATVKAATGAVPTGTVTFKDGTTTLGSAPLTIGVATLTTSKLAVEAHSITAIYTTDTDDSTSTSVPLTETITAAITTTKLASSLNPATFGTSVSFTATVAAATGSVPTGTVTFKTGTTVLGTANLVAGVATFKTSTLAAGIHSIVAVFTADTDDATSTSAPLTETITAAATSTSLTSTLAAPAFGSAVTFKTTVKATTGTVPTGTVTFKDGTRTLGTVTLSPTGTASFETSTLTVGAHVITVVYKGTTSDATSTSTAVTVTVH